MPPELRQITVGGDARGWERAGFDVRDGRIALDGLSLLVDPSSERPVSAWGLTSLGDRTDLDGITCTRPPGAPLPATPHPNGITAVDHVVVLTRDLAATTAAFGAAGAEPRGTRDVPGSEPVQRQVFFVLGPAVAELVGPVGDGAGPGRRGCGASRSSRRTSRTPSRRWDASPGRRATPSSRGGGSRRCTTAAPASRSRA